MKKSANLILVILAVLFLGGCGVQTSQPTLPVQSPSHPAQSSGSTVTINNFSFSPSTLTVKAGTTVAWINEDSATHTIKSDVFNSGELNNGQKFEFKFEKTGSFDYSCGIHPSMKGKIIIE